MTPTSPPGPGGSTNSSSTAPVGAEWITLYSDRPNRWPISGLDESQIYTARVRAHSDFGWSEYSEKSQELDMLTVGASKSSLRSGQMGK